MNREKLIYTAKVFIGVVGFFVALGIIGLFINLEYIGKLTVYFAFMYGIYWLLTRNHKKK